MFGKSMSGFSIMNQSLAGASTQFSGLKQPAFIATAQQNVQASRDAQKALE